MQDAFQLFDNGGQRYLDLENNEKDKELKKLTDYYSGTMINLFNQYLLNFSRDDYMEGMKFGEGEDDLREPKYQPDEAMEQSLKGPTMSPEMQRAYIENLRERMRKTGHQNELYGKFKA